LREKDTVAVEAVVNLLLIGSCTSPVFTLDSEKNLLAGDTAGSLLCSVGTSASAVCGVEAQEPMYY
jgi:hypothetical protein